MCVEVGQLSTLGPANFPTQEHVVNNLGPPSLCHNYPTSMKTAPANIHRRSRSKADAEMWSRGHGLVTSRSPPVPLLSEGTTGKATQVT